MAEYKKNKGAKAIKQNKKPKQNKTKNMLTRVTEI